jgi:hypothetical protein
MSPAAMMVGAVLVAPPSLVSVPVGSEPGM